MQWFKFYGGEYLADPKILSLSPAQRCCWIALLCFACTAEDGGRVKFLTEERLMTSAGLDVMREEWNDTIGVFKKLESLNMMLLDSNGDVTIRNWGKRQETYLTNAERQKRYRERQKSNVEVTRTLQQSNARIEENRIYKEKKSSKEDKNTTNTEFAAQFKKGRDILNSKKKLT